MKLSLRRIVSTMLAILAIVFLGIAGPATAAPTPTGGPTTGGTSVTINGIRFVEISTRESHTLGLTSEGTVYAWGRNDYGQLGNGTQINSNVPVKVDGLTGVTHVSAGGFHSLAMTATGVYAWGYNGSGRLGDNTTTNRSTPVEVVGVGGSGTLGPVLAISAGSYHSLAMTASGVFAWGENGWGQLGTNNQVASSFPVQVQNQNNNGNLTGVTAIATGRLFNLALVSGEVFAWGQNNLNQLGNNVSVTTGSYRSLPVNVSKVSGTGSLTGVTAIAAGDNFGLAIAGSGVLTWGAYRAVADVNNPTIITQSSRPVEILDASSNALTGVTAIAGGGNHALAISTSGLLSWGYGAYGQLGNRNTVNKLNAVAVLSGSSGSSLFSGATQITAGYCTSTVLSGPDVYSFGCNVSYGQLGDGTNISKSYPVLSANFQPTSVTFGGTAGTSVVKSGADVSVISPAGAQGSASITGTANVFGGTTAGSPSSTTWNAGTFNYIGAPTVTSSSPSVNSSSHTFTFTGSGGATFKCSSDNGGTYSTCTSPVALSSLSQGSNTFDVYQEVGGIAGAVTHVAWNVDTIAPTASFASPSTPQSRGDLTYTATFSEAMTGISAADFSVTGSTSCSVGSVTSGGGGTTYSVVVTGCAEGDVVVLRLASGAGTDAAGNSGPSSVLLASSVTITAPVVNSSSSSSSASSLPFTGMHLFTVTAVLGLAALLGGAALILIRRRRSQAQQ